MTLWSASRALARRHVVRPLAPRRLAWSPSPPSSSQLAATRSFPFRALQPRLYIARQRERFLLPFSLAASSAVPAPLPRHEAMSTPAVQFRQALLAQTPITLTDAAGNEVPKMVQAAKIQLGPDVAIDKVGAFAGSVVSPT
jgi:hypothetical protein